MKLNVSTKSNIMANMVEHLISTGETIKIFNCDFDVESHETYRDVTGTVISCDFVLSYDVTKDIKESPSSAKPENKHNNCSDDPVLEFLGTGRAEHICLAPRVIPEGKVLRCYIEDIEQDEKPMNKQELIDKAVEELNGKLPDHHDKLSRDSAGNRLFELSDGQIVRFSSVTFENRARELGWINGYKWGAEYPTNGKKPDLPDCLVVERKIWGKWSGLIISICECEDWTIPQAFRIVDQRYKPVEVEQEQADTNTTEFGKKEFPQDYSAIVDAAKNMPEQWYDYDKQQATGLPPVGVECEIIHPGISGYGWQNVTIENYFPSLDKENRVVVSNHNGDIWDEKYPVIRADDELKFRPLDWNRKVDEEKRAFVDAAISCLTEFRSANQVFAELYDAGCRFK